MARRENLAKLVYGRRDENPEEVSEGDVVIFQGRRPKASRVRTSKLARRCPTCTRPLTNDNPKKHCDSCIERSKRKPRHADSIQEATIYADARSRRTLYRAKGRIA